MLSFEVLHDEIAQKLQNFVILLIFSNFLIDFEFSPNFLVIFEKNSEKGPNELELMSAFRET